MSETAAPALSYFSLPVTPSELFSPEVLRLIEATLDPELAVNQPGALEVQTFGGRKHPTLHDCRLVSFDTIGQLEYQTFNLLEDDLHDKMAALAFRLAGPEGLLPRLPRPGMIRPAFYVTSHGVFVYDLTEGPKELTEESEISHLLDKVLVYQCRSHSKHEGLVLRAQINRLLCATLAPSLRDKVEFGLNWGHAL